MKKKTNQLAYLLNAQVQNEFLQLFVDMKLTFALFSDKFHLFYAKIRYSNVRNRTNQDFKNLCSVKVKHVHLGGKMKFPNF